MDKLDLGADLNVEDDVAWVGRRTATPETQLGCPEGRCA
jgi:hypothetical protein